MVNSEWVVEKNQILNKLLSEERITFAKQLTIHHSQNEIHTNDIG